MMMDQNDTAAVVRARTNAVLLSQSTEVFFRLSGSDSATFLQGLLSLDVEKLDVGSGGTGYHLTPKGRIVASIGLARESSDGFILRVPQGSAVDVETSFNKYLPLASSELSRTDGGATTLIGPDVPCLFEALSGLPDPGPEGVVVGLLGTDTEGIAMGNPGFGDRCVQMVTGSKEAAQLKELLLSQHGVALAGPNVSLVLRVEAGVPVPGVDFGSKSTPAELGITHAVDHTKGCYVGQEVVARMHTYGAPPRRLVGLTSELSLDQDSEIELAGRVVGTVGSPTFSPHLKQHIALAVLSASAVRVGEQLNVGGVPATVVQLPFVKSGTPTAFDPLSPNPGSPD